MTKPLDSAGPTDAALPGNLTDGRPSVQEIPDDVAKGLT